MISLFQDNALLFQYNMATLMKLLAKNKTNFWFSQSVSTEVYEFTTFLTVAAEVFISILQIGIWLPSFSKIN